MDALSFVGKSCKRPDALSKVLGTAKFTGDIVCARKDVLVAKALYPPYSHANILSIDTSAAEALKGVEIVMTAKDLPGENGYGCIEYDKPVLADKKVIYEGDAVALVAAKDKETAEKAISLIKVEYEPLPAYDDPREMIKEGAYLIHGNSPGLPNGNISDSAKIEKGDTEAGFAKADIIIDNYYETPMVEHAYLEPDICLAELDLVQGGITLYSPQHAVHGTKNVLCKVLNLPQSKIRIVSHIVGGGFGGKEDSTYDVSVIAGVLAIKTKKPVVFELTRDEIFKITGKRHGTFIHHKLCADKEGNLLAIEVDAVIDKGAYISVDAIPERISIYAGGPYNIPAAKVNCKSVFTNHPYGCAFRGLGSPQAHFAIESQMDQLAKEIGMDPIELRLKNILKDGDKTIFGQVMHKERGLGLRECIEKAKAAIHWDEKIDNSDPLIKRGKGIGCFIYGTGLGDATDGASCYIQAQVDGSIQVGISSNELGQGLITAISQITAEEMGVPMNKIQISFSDTETSPQSGPTVASRTTVMVGNAVINGCAILKERFFSIAAQALQSDSRCLSIKNSIIYMKDDPARCISLEETIETARKSQVPLSVVGSWYPPIPYCDTKSGQGEKMHTYAFGAQTVEIEVEVSTGIINVVKTVLACDMGKAINPCSVEGQMHGGMVQAIGWATMEEEFMNNGKMKNFTYHDYLIPTIMDVPTLETIIVEHPNELGPYGAKGIGEPPIVSGAPAIRNAFLAATGISMNCIPLTPVRVKAALDQNNGNLQKDNG